MVSCGLRLCNGDLLTHDLQSSIGDTNFGNGEDVDDVMAHLPEDVELLTVCERCDKQFDAASLS